MTELVHIPEITVDDLTKIRLDGDGAFDVLMRSLDVHLDKQFTQTRLRGPEYAEVYLGSMNLAMQTGMALLMGSRKISRELMLLDLQIELAKKGVEKAELELEILEASKPKVEAEILQIRAQTALLGQQLTNAVTENLVLIAQECKLRAEFDLTQANVLRTNEERALLVQKISTERAQTQSLGVDADSVIGKQKNLYGAQADGFKRDAEQKAAKLLADTWSVRRTTDEGTVADSVNQLNDATVGRAIAKLLAGVEA